MEMMEVEIRWIFQRGQRQLKVLRLLSPLQMMNSESVKHHVYLIYFYFLEFYLGCQIIFAIIK